MGTIATNSDLPARFHEATQRYLREVHRTSNNENVALILLEPFGEMPVRGVDHQRATWLCIHATRRVLPAWLEFPCDNTEPVGALNVSVKWISAGVSPRRWEQVCKAVHPRSRGIPIYDCYAPMLSNVACAAALTARFARSAEVSAAGFALSCAWAASAEVAQPPGPALPFPEWLVTVALPAAYNLRKLPRGLLFA